MENSYTGVDGYKRAMDAALRHLAQRMRSAYEIERRLSGMGFDEDCITAVIERLAELGYVNDSAFSQAFARSRRESKHKGSAAVRAELRQMGVDSELIEQALEDADDLETAKEWMDVLNRRFGSLPPREGKMKAGQFLMRKGFGWDIISSVLKDWGDNDD